MLQQRARRLRPERADAGGGLARPAADRPARCSSKATRSCGADRRRGWRHPAAIWRISPSRRHAGTVPEPDRQPTVASSLIDAAPERRVLRPTADRRGSTVEDGDARDLCCDCGRLFDPAGGWGARPSYVAEPGQDSHGRERHRGQYWRRLLRPERGRRGCCRHPDDERRLPDDGRPGCGPERRSQEGRHGAGGRPGPVFKARSPRQDRSQGK